MVVLEQSRPFARVADAQFPSFFLWRQAVTLPYSRLRRTRAESSPRTPKSAESESRERQEAFVDGFSMLLDVSNRIRTKISVKIAQISLERKIPLRSLKSVIQADLC